jgi:bacterioferritin (cytochrome b1)
MARYDYRRQYLEMTEAELVQALKYRVEKYDNYFVRNFSNSALDEQQRHIQYLERKLRLVDKDGIRI